jgi:hypothetical protein
MVAQEFYVGKFGDRRLARTGAQLYSRMVEQESVCLRRLGRDRAGEMRFGRWLSNPKVTRQEIMREASQKTGELAAGLHVLAIQDTSELNYRKHAARTQGLGRVGNGKDVGLFIHPVLVVDVQSRACLGLAHQQAWVRTKAAGNRAQLPIEEKESYRWLQAAQASKDCLQRAALVTIVADRESDIYEEWDRIPDRRTHLLTRACWDRKLADGQSLYAWLAAQPAGGCYSLAVRARAAKSGTDKQDAGKRTAHCAHMEIRYGEVSIARPAKADKAARNSIRLYAVEVREQQSSVVAEEEPIHWRLLTTHRIQGIAQALQIVEWYGERWQIEQLFRVLKKQGLNIESSQLEQGESLMKLASLATLAGVRTLQLTMAREGNTQQWASDVFDEQEMQVLEKLQPQLEGHTDKQKNPHQKKTLAWAAWMIARLGGWKGYASETKPGPITMLEGQQRFFAMAQGWKLANMCA